MLSKEDDDNLYVEAYNILILGIGEYGAKYDKNIIKYLRQHKINVEILPTDQACSTFNFLNAERRVVAAGLIPPTYIQFENDEDLLVRAQLEEKQSLYELEHGYSGSKYDDVPGELSRNLEYLKERVSPFFGTQDEKKSERKGQEGGERAPEAKKDGSDTEEKGR
nr:hypothetical protein BaRGS_020083 [Batillaria attramentaria]